MRGAGQRGEARLSTTTRRKTSPHYFISKEMEGEEGGEMPQGGGEGEGGHVPSLRGDEEGGTAGHRQPGHDEHHGAEGAEGLRANASHSGEADAAREEGAGHRQASLGEEEGGDDAASSSQGQGRPDDAVSTRLDDAGGSESRHMAEEAAGRPGEGGSEASNRQEQETQGKAVGEAPRGGGAAVGDAGVDVKSLESENKPEGGGGPSTASMKSMNASVAGRKGDAKSRRASVLSRRLSVYEEAVVPPNTGDLATKKAAEGCVNDMLERLQALELAGSEDIGEDVRRQLRAEEKIRMAEVDSPDLHSTESPHHHHHHPDLGGRSSLTPTPLIKPETTNPAPPAEEAAA